MTSPETAHPAAGGGRWMTFGAAIVRVDPGVFPPQPDTLAVIDWCDERVRRLPRLARPVIVDLCTGSGVIALVLAARHPAARILAVDSSPAAVRSAEAGVQRLARELPVDVRVRRGDATDPRVLADLRGSVDLVVANPPYLRDGSVAPPQLVGAADTAALFGGPDGLDVIRGVLAAASMALRAGGSVAVEHAAGRQQDVVELLRQIGVFDSVTGHRDHTGVARFVTARRRGPAGTPDIASA